jgi:hypothetical protein
MTLEGEFELSINRVIKEIDDHGDVEPAAIGIVARRT